MEWSNRMKNTICGCSDTCVHVVGAGAVHAARFEHREAAHDEPAANERLVHPEDEERFVASVLRQAAGEHDRIEYAGHASVSAYESLAAHRGVTLEVVARAAARGTLADIVRMAPVKPEKRRRS